MLKATPDGTHVICEHCGAIMMIDDEVQHVQYDNAEKAGYDFEKGRQRARLESMQSDMDPGPGAALKTAEDITRAPAYRKVDNNTSLWIWIIGWLCFFPIPAMVLVWRKKNTWSVRTKIIVTVIFWIVLLIIGSGS